MANYNIPKIRDDIYFTDLQKIKFVKKINSDLKYIYENYIICIICTYYLGILCFVS